MATGSPHSTPLTPSLPQRTVAIIKAHALPHRFEIENALTNAGFEIVKERRMGFMDGDPNVAALFGNDAASLTGDPVWVYVLERHRAISILHSLMGDSDPAAARENAPDSIRAIYGSSVLENVMCGSPDSEMAEFQIRSLFASSPPLPPSHIQDEVPDNTFLGAGATGSPTRSKSSHSGDSTTRVDVNSKRVGFKARPVPATNQTPSIQPRMTKAAALRAGIEPPKQSRLKATPESIKKTFDGVPGHKRSSTIAVASTAPPAISPRQTRASALRTGQIEPASPSYRKSTARQPASPERIQETFANVPGHKRRETIAVASTAPPAITPRQTKASALRTGQPVPQSKARPRSSGGIPSKSSSEIFEGVPGHKRRETISVASVLPPTTAPRLNRAAELRQAKKEGTAGPPSSFFMKPSGTPGSLSRSTSVSSLQTRTASASARSNASPSRSVSTEHLKRSESGSARPRTSTATPPRPPSIQPRLNKSALLRAQMGGAPKVKAF